MKEACSYSEYFNLLDGRGDVYVFRGQATAKYVLIPSGLRPENSATADEKIVRFVQEMEEIFGFDDLTSLELGQHFHMPTRMLDFTYSYDVALFFACYDPSGKHDDEDARVYIFNKSKYERILQEKGLIGNLKPGSTRFLYDWMNTYFDKTHKTVKIDLPIFIDATRQFDRLLMQKGLFLLWGRDSSSFGDIMEKHGIDYNEFIDMVIIKKEAKKDILKVLEKKKISADTLYMNVQKVRDLSNEIKRNN